MRPRVLIADDKPEILTKVSALLSSRFEVVAQAADGRTALEAAERLVPDLAVLDIAMPGRGGIQAAREFKRRGLRAKIVFLTLHGDDDYLTAAFESGAVGFVNKRRMQTDLIPALDHASAGFRFVSPHGFKGQRPATGLGTWFQRDRGFHTLQFYCDDHDRLTGATDYVIAALRKGATVIFVDSKVHLTGLMERLHACDVDLGGAIDCGGFIALDVHREVLPYIIVNGRPDAAQMSRLFDSVAARDLRIGQDDRRLAMAGEIAPTLWAEGMPEAALEVERLTDEFVHARSASVFCTYPMKWLYEKRHHETMAKLCALHTSVVPKGD